MSVSLFYDSLGKRFYFLPFCDSRVFFIRKFWENERPTSTEDETSTENSFYPKSETETEVSIPESERRAETIEDKMKNQELSKIELKNENRKLEYTIKRYQKNLARLTTENGAAENERIELENELLACKSHNDQLESDFRILEIEKMKYQTESKGKQAQLDTYEKQNHALIKCKFFG